MALKQVKVRRGRGADHCSMSKLALWSLGFRPFYLIASVFASLSVALWACEYAGLLRVTYVRGAAWHGHEMLFGYTMAVVAGFLFTAVRNWTGRPTPAGGLLAGYVLLWLAGRLLVLTPYGIIAAIVNAAFPLAVAVGIAIPMARSGNRRNYFFVALLCAVGLATLALHLSSLGWVAWPERVGLRVGLDVVLFIVATIAGRVIPMFTNNAIPGADASRKPWLERTALAGLLALLAADLFAAPAWIVAPLALGVAAAHAARLWLWRPWRTLRTPLVWILHAAYGWIAIHLLLRALAAWGLIAEPLATHALTIGVVGGMTMGMMTRTSLGHTGRVLAAGGFEVACYALVQLAAVIRVFGPLAWPAGYLATVVASGVLWSVAFGLFAIRYWPVLTGPRADGKPG